MEKEAKDLITQTLFELKVVEEKFRKIQENPALHGAEYGLTILEQKTLEKLIGLMGEANLAADEILKRSS